MHLLITHDIIQILMLPRRGPAEVRCTNAEPLILLTCAHDCSTLCDATTLLLRHYMCRAQLYMLGMRTWCWGLVLQILPSSLQQASVHLALRKCWAPCPLYLLQRQS